MKKLIKKIVAVATTLTMVSAMGIMAFAADSYTFVGDTKLFNSADDKDASVGWVTTAADQKLTAAEDGIYTGKFTALEAGEFECKLVGDGDIFAWAYQLCIGSPENGWGDNMTQFKMKVEAGEYTVVAKPAEGLMVLVQNGKVCDFTVRYNSWDEDPADFVEPSVAAISKVVGKSGKNYEPKDFDASLAAFKTKAVELVGASAPAETTAETTKAPASAETTAPKPVKTGDVAPMALVVTLLAAVAVVAVVAKKKEA